MRWQRELNRQLRPYQLTQPQFALLAVVGWLTRDGQAVTQQDVVDFLGLDRMHVSQVVTRLTVDGLIARNASDTDLRAKHLHLTNKGRALLVQVMPLVEEFDRAFFESVSKDDRPDPRQARISAPPPRTAAAPSVPSAP